MIKNESMKYFFTMIFCFVVVAFSQAQSIGMGTSTPDTTAQLDISSSSRGLLIPRMPWGAIYPMKNPAKGLMVFDSTNNRLVVNMGTTSQPLWQSVDNNSSWQLGVATGGIARGFGTYDKSPIYFVLGGQTAGIFDPLDTTLTAHTLAIGESSMLRSRHG